MEAGKLLEGRHSGSFPMAQRESWSYLYAYHMQLTDAYMHSLSLYGSWEAVGGEALRLVSHGPEGELVV
jgi:hypothetical protein